MAIEIRAFEDSMLPAYTEVWNRSRAEVPMHLPETAETMRVLLVKDPDFDPRGIFVAFEGDGAVGFGESYIQRTRVAAGKSQGFITIEVVPERRGQGIEHELARKTMGYLKSRGILEVILWTIPSIEWRVRLAADLGLERFRTYWEMRADLTKPVPDIPFPPGISAEYRTFADASLEFIREWARAKDAAFVDHFNSAPSDPEMFYTYRELKDTIGRYTMARSSSGRPIGVCLAEVEGSGGVKHAWVNILGVTPGERRKGLGRALLADALKWARSLGETEAFLGMDAQNEKALGLYRSVGFEVFLENATYHKFL